MKIIRYPQYTALSRPSAVTIGNFDGLHLGHQALLNKTFQVAADNKLQSVVVVMEPLPEQYFKDRFSTQLLTPFKQKARLLAAMGFDVLCVLNFNQELAALSATSFLEDIIITGLNSEAVIVGHDFHFGANRSGDAAMLQRYSETHGLEIIVLPPIKINDDRVSSTAIRRFIAEADFNRAKQAMGRDYSIIGRVGYGRQMGRQLGYPTLNIELNKGGNPLHGIYIVKVCIESVWHEAVASVGYNPTVGGNAKRLEVHVLDYSDDVYGQTIKVLFYKKLRNEVEFDSLSTLRTAIENDVQQTKLFFAEQKGELV